MLVTAIAQIIRSIPFPFDGIETEFDCISGAERNINLNGLYETGLFLTPKPQDFKPR